MSIQLEGMDFHRSARGAAQKGCSESATIHCFFYFQGYTYPVFEHDHIDILTTEYCCTWYWRHV